ncbi:Ubiquitin-associated domain-containing protein 1 [Frankliniella fusca]|uniref:Ubiquitin-associated domain-containing protein 1 n=1 Tax=Frankliniella fusca TaxID=407009 RepID=A0AAE1HLT5_9NEOP|nr:Ubiquitin-associated domain-containing protein 1 [Frankliniella fusca]
MVITDSLHQGCPTMRGVLRQLQTNRLMRKHVVELSQTHQPHLLDTLSAQCRKDSQTNKLSTNSLPDSHMFVRSFEPVEALQVELACEARWRWSYRPSTDHNQIIGPCTTWKAKISPGAKISKLTSMAASHFFGSASQSSSKILQFRMVVVRTRALLLWDKTVSEEELRDNDVAVKLNVLHLCVDAFEQYGERFSKDSPRIFMSLIETGAHLLSLNPNGMEVFQQVKKEWNSKREIPLHSPYVKQLIDMGFSENLVVKALKDKKMNVNHAMEWLLEQSSSTKAETDQAEEPSCSQSKPLTVLDAFNDLMQAALSRRHENIKLDMKHVEHLKQMGFQAKEIEKALKETDNNINAAAAVLKGSASTSPTAMYNHLDLNGSMYKALMGSEIIQLNLKKPKFLLALLSILEDPQSLTLWMKDREISNVLTHIILLHNTEISGGRQVT